MKQFKTDKGTMYPIVSLIKNTSTFGDFDEMTVYSWGDYNQMLTDWAIVGEAKQDYCENMKETSYIDDVFSNSKI